MNRLENAERVLLTAGLLLLGFCALAFVGGRTQARVAVNKFKSDIVHLGNTAIAGHRDGLFRVLKDIAPTDTLQLVTKSGVHTYLVDYLRIASPEDVSVLRTNEIPSVTLVTCYPFYVIGSASKRFIVHASLQPTGRDAVRRSVQVSSTAKNVKSQEN